MNQNKVKIIVTAIWTTFAVLVIIIPAIFYLVRIDFNDWFGGLPSLQELERPDPILASELLSADGSLLGKYYRNNRTLVTYEELSSELVNTLLVTEDTRFKDHSGVDLKGLIRAVIGKLTFQFRGGGSTITMQLAENLYRTTSENRGKLYAYRALGPIITKLKEWIIAVQLEKAYTKEEILAMYLNQVEFGSNAFGIHAAAETFYKKFPSQLNYNESAILVGAINAPTRWSPILNPENAKRKRTEVLYNVYKKDLISREVYDSLNNADFGLNYRVASHNTGPAQYFRKVIGQYLLYWCKERGIDLYEDGLRIYTTLDSRLQRYAEESMQEHMRKLQTTFNESWQGRDPWVDSKGNPMEGFLKDAMKRTEAYRNLVEKFGKDSDSVNYYLKRKKGMTVFSWDGDIDTIMSSYDSLSYYKRFLQAGFMAMDPRTGHIKAWVGGINHEYFKSDHVKQTRRQPGSTFKPFVYTVAIDNGWSPCYPVVDAPIAIALPGQDPPVWQPENAEGKFSERTFTIRQAMARSINSITAHVIDKVGAQTVVNYAQRMGIESPLDPVPSLALGTSDVTLYELLGAYSTFVNKGVYTEPVYLIRIEDQNGNVIQQFPSKTREALNEETAYVMLHMLKGTTEEPGGTGMGIERSLRENNEIAAKTGTTQNASDGWFMGMTHDLAAGGWVGGDDRSIHFPSWVMGQGARTAMPIWENFMTKVYADPTVGYTKGSFDKPITPLSVELNCDRYKSLVNPIDSIKTDIISEDDIL